MATATWWAPERAPVSPVTHLDVRVRLHEGTVVSLALDEPGAAPGDRAELAARDAGGRLVGRVAYRRVYGPRAELAIDVDDAYWHRGLPALLIGSLRERAHASGISTFLGTAGASDVRLLALLSAEFGARCTRDGRHVRFELACGPPAPARAAPELLRGASLVTARRMAEHH
jgi:hypothetical protein